MTMQIHCLSIMQPFANDILNRQKPVENRSWTWLKDRDWKKEGAILLGIHASTNQWVWNEYSDAEQIEKSTLSPSGKVEFGKVLGVVDLVEICRPMDLPKSLAKHPSVNRSRDNWCWVLKNPRWLPRAVKTPGQARLFFASIPNRPGF